MNDRLDTLLRDPLLQPPADFTQAVMQRVVASSSRAEAPPLRWHALRLAAASTAMIAGALLGLTQLAAFVFGLWLSGAAM